MRRVGTLATAAFAAFAFAFTSSPGAAKSVPHWSAWLCFPGAANNWCSVDLTTTVIPADGSLTNVHVSVPADPPIDCFYLYPTVSEEARPNSDLVVRA